MDVGGSVCIAGKICVSREEAGINVVCLVVARLGSLAAAAAAASGSVCSCRAGWAAEETGGVGVLDRPEESGRSKYMT
jgi:hypothetical protein